MTAPAESEVASPALAQLLARLEDLPTQEPVLTRVLQLVNDDDCSATTLGATVSLDPSLTIRLLRLANSAYYGMSGRIATAQRAVTVIGFTTVGALVASSATGLDGSGGAPVGYWRRAACTAVAASLLASTIGADQPQAFCAGLLADFGGALLHQADPVEYLAAVQSVLAGEEDLIEAERKRFGWAHDELAARVLSLWHFPPPLTAAVGGHHRAVPPSAEPLIRTVRAAMIVVDQVPGIAPHPCPPAVLTQLTQGRLTTDALPRLVERVQTAGGDLALALTG
jgi:HD-like signal output (HDOD) protein